MGWYHVNKIGKGICLGDVDGIHYNEDFIEKHTPTKGEALEVNYHHLKEVACSPAGLQFFPTQRTVRHSFCPCYRVQWAFTAVAGGIAVVRIGLCGI